MVAATRRGNPLAGAERASYRRRMGTSHPLAALALARLFVDEKRTTNGPERRMAKPRRTSGHGASVAVVLGGVLTLVVLACALIFG
jgi:hypothetical protein